MCMLIEFILIQTNFFKVSQLQLSHYLATDATISLSVIVKVIVGAPNILCTSSVPSVPSTIAYITSWKAETS